MKEVKVKEINTSIEDTLQLTVEVEGITYSGFLLKNG